MKSIDANDIIFDFECDNTIAFSYFGWEFNNCHAFYNYMIGYKAAADATYESFKNAVLSHDNQIADTICYPLVYLYRHMTELMLKYSYIELKKNRSKEEIESFLKNGHNLNRLWEIVKVDFERLSKRIGYDVDISAIEHYITELSNTDGSSMAYRYPIDKKELNRFHDKNMRLNIPLLKERMDAFYDYMVECIYQLSKHLEDDTYDAEFDNRFCVALTDSMCKVKDALKRLEHNIDKSQERSNEKVWLNLSDIDDVFHERDEIHKWIGSFSEREKSVILLLYYTGDQIPQNKLAIDPIERKKDVMKLIFGNSQGDSELDSPRSYFKDDSFENHIAYGGTISKKYIELTLNELGIVYSDDNKESH